MYVEVPIIGSGTREDAYRAQLAVPKSVVIPSDLATGKPKHTTTIAWVDAKYDTDVDRGIVRIPPATARDLLRQLDPKVNVDRVEQKRPTARLSPLLIPGLVGTTAPMSRRAALIGAVLGLGALLLPSRAHARTFTQSKSDDFNRTNSSDIGTDWDAGYTSYFPLSIINNSVTPALANEGNVCIETHNNGALPNDQYAQLTLANWEGENLAGVLLRASAPATLNAYFMNTNSFTSGSVHKNEISKFVAGTWTTITDGTVSAWTELDIIKGAVLGTGLYLFKNGVEVLSGSDSAFSAGRAGIIALWFTGTPFGDVDVDDWAAGEVEANGAVSPSVLNLLGVGK